MLQLQCFLSLQQQKKNPKIKKKHILSIIFHYYIVLEQLGKLREFMTKAPQLSAYRNCIHE